MRGSSCVFVLLCAQRLPHHGGENGSPNDSEYDDVTIGKVFVSPLFTQEREDASRGRAYHCQEECRGEPLFGPQLIHKFRAHKKVRDTGLKVNKLGLFWNDKENRFSLIVKQRFENTNSRPIMTEEI